VNWNESCNARHGKFPCWVVKLGNAGVTGRKNTSRVDFSYHATGTLARLRQCIVRTMLLYCGRCGSLSTPKGFENARGDRTGPPAASLGSREVAVEWIRLPYPPRAGWLSANPHDPRPNSAPVPLLVAKFPDIINRHEHCLLNKLRPEHTRSAISESSDY
jgi:hypothetical protein